MIEPDYGRLRSTSWSEALHEIERLLTGLVEAIDAYLVINVDVVDDVFVQFHCSGNGIITAEAAATYRCGSNCFRRHLLEPQAAARLIGLGWQPPDLDPLRIALAGTGHPNFYKTWGVGSGWPSALFSDLTVRTFHDVWQLRPTDCVVRGSLLDAGEPPECN
jgi:hypothetical protein